MYKRWASQSRTYYPVEGSLAAAGVAAGNIALPLNSAIPTNGWEQYTVDSNVSDSYLDEFVILIANRWSALVLLALVAMWKDGEQLRYWIAFYIVHFWITFQTCFGVFMYINDTSGKIGGFV